MTLKYIYLSFLSSAFWLFYSLKNKITHFFKCNILNFAKIPIKLFGKVELMPIKKTTPTKNCEVALNLLRK